MHIKNARTTLTVDASQRLRPWTMPVHFNELRYPWNANDAKINLTNLHSHLRKKSPSPLNTAGCTRRKTNKKKSSPIHAFSLSYHDATHLLTHSAREITIIITITKMQICCTTRFTRDQTTVESPRISTDGTKQGSGSWAKGSHNTSLRFWYGTLRRCSTDASAT